MANLMNDRSDMPALYKKYQGFRVPAFQVLLGEGKKDLKSQLNGQTEQLEISLSLDNASSAVFQISNAYDFKNHKFRGEIMNSLTLGNLVQVNIGYGSSLDSVFCGYIHSVKQDFQEMPRLSVTALDDPEREAGHAEHAGTSPEVQKGLPRAQDTGIQKI